MSDKSDKSIFLGRSPESQYLLARQGNRHGLIAGATGTGKTISLRVLAEGFSRLGVPVFMADVKGDLSGLAHAGLYAGKVRERAEEVGLEGFEPTGFPVIFWDLYGEQGHPVRAVVQDMGPLLLSRLMELNDVQEGILNVAFSVSENERLPMLDFKDLRSVLENIAGRAEELRGRYGNVSPQSVGAIQRKLLTLERQEAERFFGEPELELDDLMRVDKNGRGYISILASDRLLAQSPQLYSIFLMWLLSRLFEELPEQGDSDQPKLVFFFDEAHLLFNDAPKALVSRIEQVARLIRSKGVGVYFVSQSPSDIPENILGQLGNRVQHALRAFTPKDQKAVRSAAESFRPNPAFDTATVIQALGIGEALTSTLDGDGVPTPVERTLMAPPASQLAPLSPEERRAVIDQSPVQGKYERALDRDSAYERLSRRENERHWDRHVEAGADKPAAKSSRKSSSSSSSRRETVAEAAAKSVARSVASGLGRRIVTSLFNLIFKK